MAVGIIKLGTIRRRMVHERGWLRVGEKYSAFFVGCTATPTSRHGSPSTNVSRSMLSELAALLGWLETDCAVLWLVAAIQHACLAAYKQPASTSANGLEEVQWIHSIYQCLEAKASTPIRRLAIAVEIGHFVREVG